MGSLHLEMDGGTKVSQVASWNRPESYPTWGDVTMELIGEKGVLTIDAFNQKLGVYSDAVGKGQWVGWGDDMDEGLVGDFVAAVREERDPVITGEDGLRAVEVTVAAEQSARTGEVVKI